MRNNVLRRVPSPTSGHRHVSKSRLLSISLFALTFAIAKDLWHRNLTLGALWEWRPSHTGSLIHDPGDFDWEAASLCDPYQAYINKVLLLDYTIDRFTLLFLLYVIRMCSPRGAT
jgi:hypothetical protein